MIPEAVGSSPIGHPKPVGVTPQSDSRLVIAFGAGRLLQGLVRLATVGHQQDSFLTGDDRLMTAPLGQEAAAQADESFEQIRVGVERQAQVPLRRLNPIQFREGLSQAEMCVGIPAVEVKGALIEQERLVKLSLGTAKVSEMDQGAEVSRVLLENAVEQLSGPRPVAILLMT